MRVLIRRSGMGFAVIDIADDGVQKQVAAMFSSAISETFDFKGIDYVSIQSLKAICRISGTLTFEDGVEPITAMDKHRNEFKVLVPVEIAQAALSLKKISVKSAKKYLESVPAAVRLKLT